MHPCGTFKSKEEKEDIKLQPELQRERPRTMARDGDGLRDDETSSRKSQRGAAKAGGKTR